MASPASQAIKQSPLDMQGFISLLTQPLIIGGFTLYGLGALIWLSVLSNWEVSKAYPLVGLGFVLTAIVGFAIGESLSVQRLVGILLICTGVWVVARS